MLEKYRFEIPVNKTVHEENWPELSYNAYLLETRGNTLKELINNAKCHTKTSSGVEGPVLQVCPNELVMLIIEQVIKVDNEAKDAQLKQERGF